MFKIGEFSRFTRVSVKMLRHYDRIGLLEPAHTDAFTGYRYYSTEQLPRLNRIIALKDLGFSLEQIKNLVDDDLNAEQMRGLLKLRRAELKQHLYEEQMRLAQVEQRLAQIETEGEVPPYDVVIRRVEARRVASIRATIPTLSDDIPEMFDEVETYVSQKRARASAPPLLIYYDEEFVEDEIDVEVAVPVDREIDNSGRVMIRTLPAVPQMAALVYSGSYAGMDAAITHLYRWVETHGYRIAGPPRDVYLRFNAEEHHTGIPEAYITPDSTLYVTEFQVPVEQSQTD